MIDLHVHSIYSDGEHSPLTVLDMCKQKGVSTVAITDHNSMEGSKIAIKENPYEDIKVISGIELGARYNVKGGQLHILGYNFDLENKPFNQITQDIMSENIQRLECLIGLLKTYYNISFKDEDVEKIFESVGNIGRPDVARLCVDYGHCSTVHEAFEKYFNPVDDKLMKRKAELTDKLCIEYIRNAGGIACLAHPIELKKDYDELRSYIATLVSYGLEAIEVYQSKHDDKYSQMLLKLTEEFGLLYSVGSDYHGPIVTPDIEIGSGKDNNLNKDYATILTKIQE